MADAFFGDGQGAAAASGSLSGHKLPFQTPLAGAEGSVLVCESRKAAGPTLRTRLFSTSERRPSAGW